MMSTRKFHILLDYIILPYVFFLIPRKLTAYVLE